MKFNARKSCIKFNFVYSLKHSRMKSPFSAYLSRLLEKRGAAAELARNSGVVASQISRIAEGTIIPERDTFAKIVSAMSQEDRNAITVEYLRWHRPEGTDIEIIVGDSAGTKDKLTAACEKLDLHTREALATIIEGVNRAPEQGTAWLRNMAALFLPAAREGDIALAAEQPSPPPAPKIREDVIYPKAKGTRKR